MTINERIRILRKDELHLTLEAFGKKVGVTKAAISDIERGRNNVTDQMFNSICRVFNVNENWLRDGQGEVFAEVPEDAVDALCHEFNLDSLDRVIIQEYLRLDAHSRDVLKAYMRNIRERVKKDTVQPQVDEIEAYRADQSDESPA